jgi:ATP-dependent Lhr-like helicase
VEAVSRGVLFPKFRADLLATAAVTRAMKQAAVEETRVPQNPLDVLAQQVAAVATQGEYPVDELYALVRRAAPYAGLGRAAFEGVLDMLAGRYPPTTSRACGRASSGTAGAAWCARGRHAAGGGRQRRHDPRPRALRRLPAAAPSRPARGRARRGDGVREPRGRRVRARRLELAHRRDHPRPRAGRPGARRAGRDAVLEGRPRRAARSSSGRAIGRLTRELAALPREAARERLRSEHDFDARAAHNLVQYLDDQRAATTSLPDDKTLVLERTRDEMGDWRLILLSPWGGRVHAPWTIALAAAPARARGARA